MNSSYLVDTTYGVSETTGILGALAGATIFIWIITMLVSVLMIVSMWKIFTKAGKPGWAAIIPIYNNYIMCEIAGKEWWYILLLFVPIAQIYAMFVIYDSVAKKFGKSTGFTFGMILVPYVFFPMLAFGKNNLISDSVNTSTVNDDTMTDVSVEEPVQNAEVNMNQPQMENFNVNQNFGQAAMPVMNDFAMPNVEQAPVMEQAPVANSFTQPAVEQPMMSNTSNMQGMTEPQMMQNQGMPVMNDFAMPNVEQAPVMEQAPVANEFAQPAVEQPMMANTTNMQGMAEPQVMQNQGMPVMNDFAMPNVEQAPIMNDQFGATLDEPVMPAENTPIQPEVNMTSNEPHTSMWSNNNTNNGQM